MCLAGADFAALGAVVMLHAICAAALNVEQFVIYWMYLYVRRKTNQIFECYAMYMMRVCVYVVEATGGITQYETPNCIFLQSSETEGFIL